MSYTNKPFEELDLIDDYLMNAVTGDPEVGEPFCRAFLSELLQRKIGRIHVATQRIILPTAPDKRGIRMDVEVEEETDDTGFLSAMNIYDVEPHRKPQRETEAGWRKRDNLPRRNRFYQAKIDSRHMKSGEKGFNGLPNLYMINVLDYDPFGYDQMIYTVQNRCKEVDELEYDDGVQFLYFNTTGTEGGCEEVRKLLNFIRHSSVSNAVDDSTRELYDYVSRVKMQPEVRESYMRLDEIIEIEREDAAYEARQEATHTTAITTTQDNIVELLEELGNVSEDLEAKIRSEEDISILKKWHKLSAKADSLEKFINLI